MRGQPRARNSDKSTTLCATAAVTVRYSITRLSSEQLQCVQQLYQERQRAIYDFGSSSIDHSTPSSATLYIYSGLYIAQCAPHRVLPLHRVPIGDSEPPPDIRTPGSQRRNSLRTAIVSLATPITLSEGVPTVLRNSSAITRPCPTGVETFVMINPGSRPANGSRGECDCRTRELVERFAVGVGTHHALEHCTCPWTAGLACRFVVKR